MLVPCEMGSHVGVKEIGSTYLSVVSPLASPSAEPNVFIVPIVIVLNICCTLLYVIVLVLLDPFLYGLSLPVLFEWLDINCTNTRMLGDVMIWSIVYFHMFIPILSILVYSQQSGQLVSENDVLNLWSSGFKAALAWIIHFVMLWFQLIIDSCLFACLLGLVCWTRHCILTPQLVFILAWVADSSVNLFYIHSSG